jgi:hypothetical protein
MNDGRGGWVLYYNFTDDFTDGHLNNIFMAVALNFHR